MQRLNQISNNLVQSQGKMISSASKILKEVLKKEVAIMKQTGTYKAERIITSPQSSQIHSNGKEVLNFCANNYLGLSSHPRLIQAAKRTLDTHGFGMSSVRFICGTQDIHKQLQKSISEFYGLEDTILFPSGFDANAGFFEAIYNQQDYIVSDALNHASIIDGMRLCKAKKDRYVHMDMKDLQEKLKANQGARMRCIVTDGVFSMDGDLTPLDKIYQLAQKYNAQIYLDECHAAGFIGKTGRGTPEYFGLQGKIDFISSTLGKAMGGASGGFVSGSFETVDILKNKARTYLFSNSIAPCIVGASLEAFKMVKQSSQLLEQIKINTKLFRTEMTKAGFTLSGHEQSPIAPVWFGDARVATKMSSLMMEKYNVFVIGFSFPVVPKDKARIRIQLSAAHTEEQVRRCIQAFKGAAKQLNIL